MRTRCRQSGMRISAAAAVCAAASFIAQPSVAAEPAEAPSISVVLQDRTPRPAQVSLATVQPLEFQDKPAWARRLQFAARHGWTIAPLRRGKESDLVFGVHRDGYVGVFTTVPSRKSSRPSR
jgi:hypothetical protein